MKSTHLYLSCSCRHALSVALVFAAAIGAAQQPVSQSSTRQQPAGTMTQEMPKPSVSPAFPGDATPSLTISAGDLIDVDVFDTPELSGKLRVDERGQIELPIAGKLEVQGDTSAEVARAIEARLKSAKIMNDPHVSVLVLEYVSQGATVYGEVTHPGIFPVYGRVSLADLIAEAGGPLPSAGTDITISHRGSSATQLHVNFDKTRPTQTGAQLILPGDTVVVPRAGLIYVLGAVEHQGSFLVSSDGDKLTLLQALALAQGAKSDAKLKDSKLLRTTGSGREEISIDLSRIIASKAPDMLLQQGDVLFVPTSTFKAHAFTIFQVAFEAAAAVALYARP